MTTYESALFRGTHNGAEYIAQFARNGKLWDVALTVGTDGGKSLVRAREKPCMAHVKDLLDRHFPKAKK